MIAILVIIFNTDFVPHFVHDLHICLYNFNNMISNDKLHFHFSFTIVRSK